MPRPAVAARAAGPDATSSQSRDTTRSPTARLSIVEHPRLQAECDDGCTKNQRSIDVAAQLRGLARGEQDRYRDVEQKVQDEKRLGARKQLRPVTQHAPG